MDENDKKIVMFVGIFILIIVIVVIVINVFWNKKSNQFLIIDGTLILEKQGNKWSQLTDLNDDVLKATYTIDNGETSHENVKLNYNNNKWYYMDQNYHDIDDNNFRIAYSNMDKIKLGSFTSQYGSDEDINLIDQVLSKQNIENYQSFLPNTRKTIVDLDNDGTNEIIYTTTNISLSYDGKKQMAALFLVKEGEVKQVIDINEKNPYWVTEILDLNNDQKYEVIINKGDIDLRTFNSCYQIYEMENNKLKLQQDCTLQNK